jgi:cell division septation protein DedD
MSKKYIKQINSTNFIYPNNTVAEYDVEIIHNVNDNAPIGTVTSATITGATATGMTLNWSGTWDLNNAEPFIQDNTSVTTITIHGMGPTQEYFKPFRLLEEYTTGVGTPNVNYSGQTVSLTPALFGLSTFTDGTYYFEFRVVSKLAIAPICASIVVSGIVPITPTPTPTATQTPTPTPSATPEITTTPTPTPTPTPTSYTIYLADEYSCTFPGCALQRLDVEVALPTSHTPQYGKFYPDDALSGFVYLLHTASGTGPGIILNLANFTACNSACIV